MYPPPLRPRSLHPLVTVITAVYDVAALVPEAPWPVFALGGAERRLELQTKVIRWYVQIFQSRRRPLLGPFILYLNHYLDTMLNGC